MGKGFSLAQSRGGYSLLEISFPAINAKVCLQQMHHLVGGRVHAVWEDDALGAHLRERSGSFYNEIYNVPFFGHCLLTSI